LTAVTALALVGLLGFGACSGSSDADRGMAAEKPGDLVQEALERYYGEGDYEALFSSKADRAKVAKALDTLEESSVHWVLTNESPSFSAVEGVGALKEGDAIIGLWGSATESFPYVFTGEGYAIVRQNEASGNYVIIDLDFEKSK
jgi:hypothetical protein